MASQGQVLFWSMTTVILSLAAVIGLIIGFGVSGRRSIAVTALTSPGNLGQRGVLGCTFEPDIQLSSTAIQWAKEGVAGLVHEFRSGQEQLQEQAELFQGRTALFAEELRAGNASLQLSNVQLSDAGTYQCSVTTARGTGVAVLHYRTGAFSSPEVHVERSSSSGARLRCEAARWFPAPAVHWQVSSAAGEQLLAPGASPSYQLNADNITLTVLSSLHNITANATYSCVMENTMAKATGSITVTDFSIPGRTSWQLLTLKTESVSSSLPACPWLLLLLALCLL
ncbi:VTCN1 inhibitor, partial [Bucco capensis]|nr:VTCN1 inhibitor [Bucco capensis]